MKSDLKITLPKASIQVMILLLPLLSNILFSANARADTNSNLTIDIAGIKKPSGKICASLFSEGKGFPSNSEKALQSECIDVTEEANQKLTFKDLKPGNYAVALIHDANEDGMLNSNSFGMPTEGFGFSNNPLILTGPPNFNNAAVSVTGLNTNIEIKVQYLF